LRRGDQCRRKLVNFIIEPIYGGTGIKASQRFRNDPRVAQQPVLAAAGKINKQHRSKTLLLNRGSRKISEFYPYLVPCM
jgi:hypothetical protein